MGECIESVALGRGQMRCCSLQRWRQRRNSLTSFFIYNNVRYKAQVCIRARMKFPKEIQPLIIFEL